jgi:hypothetical protein
MSAARIEQLDRRQLAGMSADEIVAARQAGQLEELLGRVRPGRPGRFCAAAPGRPAPAHTG